MSVALLQLCLTPVWQDVQAARATRWSRRAASALTLARTPGQPVGVRLWLQDGRDERAVLLHIESEADSQYQKRLDLWQAGATPHSALPRLGQSITLSNRFKGGQAIRGPFLGFEGPFLLLGKEGDPGGLPRQIELRQLLLAGPAGTLMLDGSHLDQRESWPPSRGKLVIQSSQGVEWIPLDEVLDLRIRQSIPELVVVLLVIAALALPILVARVAFRNLGGAVAPQ